MTPLLIFFFFNDTATTEIYTLSLHDALPISTISRAPPRTDVCAFEAPPSALSIWQRDRKSTRLNSSHGYISYAVFCLKKKTAAEPSCRRERHLARARRVTHTAAVCPSGLSHH